MPTVSLRLRPQDVVNPDADIRHVLPDLIASRSGGTVRENGYDYAKDDTMVIFLDCDNIESTVHLVELVLRTEVFLGNRLDGIVTICPAG